MAAQLVPEVADVPSLGLPDRAAMFHLYARYYEPACSAAFHADLAGKSHAVLLRDASGTIQGFSTLRTWSVEMPWGRQRVIFSGDTVVEQRFWGSRALPLAWIEHAGAVQADDPLVPLWWFLIAKGHRTFRLMSGFAHMFFPAPGGLTPPHVSELMIRLGETAFGSRFDRRRGIVRHKVGDAALKAEFAGDGVKRAGNPLASFFEACNPGHALGDELLCLCELSAANLRTGARERFLAGHERRLEHDSLRRRA